MKVVCKDPRDNSLVAIRQRYGMAAIKAATSLEYCIHDSLRDIPFLLKEIDIMTPRADEHGRVTIENEMLKEEVSSLAETIKDLEEELAGYRYESRIANYSQIY